AVIMKMLDAIDRGEGPTILGDGSEAFDFVAVKDCGRANLCAMRADVVDSFYNVGTGKRTSLKELAEMLLRLTGSNQPIQYAPRSQATLVRNRIGSPKRAAAEIGFGHRRLAIIDLSPAGRQPMATEDGRYLLTYNGEVYNFKELRTELEAIGYHFRSRSDSEVVLKAFAAWGSDALLRFNGMFAL